MGFELNDESEQSKNKIKKNRSSPGRSAGEGTGAPKKAPSARTSAWLDLLSVGALGAAADS